jgi:alpha-D-ribose 1-methylphosphonate 5-triphosphate synthase subunit PhnG
MTAPSSPAPADAPAQAATAQRQACHAVLARAGTAELEAAWAPWPQRLSVEPLRRAEPGLVMLRGRVAGSGAPFNLGEATVTRCAVQLRQGVGEAAITGVGYTLGRDRRKAELIACFDALAQLPEYAQALADTVLTPLAQRQAQARQAMADAAAGSQVAFFTMVRGET